MKTRSSTTQKVYTEPDSDGLEEIIVSSSSSSPEIVEVKLPLNPSNNFLFHNNDGHFDHTQDSLLTECEYQGVSFKHNSSQTSIAAKKQQVFLKEVRYLMYGFGDVSQPLPESVVLMEELLQSYLTELCENVLKISKKAPKTSHFLSVLANDPKKYYRAQELLSLDKELKSARAVFDVNEMAKTGGDLSSLEVANKD